MIHLEPVTQDNYAAVTGLKVGSGQEKFVSTVAESLAQAELYKETAYPFAVYDDDVIVGFIMMGYYEAKQYYTLWKLLIDHRFQSRGYGRQALESGLKYIRERFGPEDIYTGVIPENFVAKSLYESAGFEYTGVTEDGMEEMRLIY